MKAEPVLITLKTRTKKFLLVVSMNLTICAVAAPAVSAAATIQGATCERLFVSHSKIELVLHAHRLLYGPFTGPAEGPLLERSVIAKVYGVLRNIAKVDEKIDLSAQGKTVFSPRYRAMRAASLLTLYIQATQKVEEYDESKFSQLLDEQKRISALIIRSDRKIISKLDVLESHPKLRLIRQLEKKLGSRAVRSMDNEPLSDDVSAMIAQHGALNLDPEVVKLREESRALLLSRKTPERALMAAQIEALHDEMLQMAKAKPTTVELLIAAQSPRRGDTYISYFSRVARDGREAHVIEFIAGRDDLLPIFLAELKIDDSASFTHAAASVASVAKTLGL